MGPLVGHFRWTRYGKPWVSDRLIRRGGIPCRIQGGALLRDSTLRRLEGADDDQEQREAANAFRGFAEFEVLLQA
jgi:hypothetical protein